MSDTRTTVPPGGVINVRAAEPLPGDDFYLVDMIGDSVTAMRDGKAVNLKPAEAKAVRRWVLKEPKETP